MITLTAVVALLLQADPRIPGVGPAGEIVKLHTGFKFTEGPAVDAEGAIYFTDIPNNRIHRIALDGTLSTVLEDSGACNGLMVDAKGQLIACQGGTGRVISIDPATKRISVVADHGGGKIRKPNDLVIDAHGGVYFTDPDEKSVHYAAHGQVTCVINDLPRPNGVLLSPDERTLIVLPSGVPDVMTYPVLSPGKLGPGRRLAALEQAPGGRVRGGDGLTVDVKGNLYLTQPSLSAIQVVTPEGKTLGILKFPEGPSNCTFGGPDMKTLFVTARTSVYAVKMDATGHRFPGARDSAKKIEIRGAYGDPQPFWQTGATLRDHGVNAIFVRSQSLSPEVVARARAEGCRVYAEYATLNGSYGDWVEKHPDAHPIDDKGRPAPKATWFMGVCPTNKGFREFRMNGLREMVKTLDVDGVWMDYLHWHAQFEDAYPVLLKTCFNDSCLAAFEAWSGVKVEGDTIPRKAAWIFRNAARAWEDWRVSVLVDWAREFREIVKSVRPHALIGNFQAAWKDDDFWGARRRCLGLDFEQLAKHVDVFSPMPYHGVSGMAPEYVADYTEWFSRRLPLRTEPGKYPQLWPIVQANDVKPDVFETVLRGGLTAKSTGVMMFALEHVARDPGKMAAMKKVYLEK